MSDKKIEEVDIAEQKYASLNMHVTAILLGMNIFNEIRQQLKLPLRRENITFNQWLVLVVLILNRADTPTKVRRLLNADAAAITRRLDGLELCGLVRRIHSTKDRRVTRVELTKKGKEVAEKMYSPYVSVFQNLEYILSTEELELCNKIEHCIATHLKETL